MKKEKKIVDNNKKNTKKILIVSGICFIVLCAIVLALLKIFVFDRKIEVTAIQTIDLNKAKTEANKIDLVKQNIVKIVNTVSNGEIVGTGFFDPDGYLITNSHVVDIKGDIVVYYPNNTKTKAQLVSNDISSDIALLAVESPKVLALVTTTTLQLNVTDDLYALGYSLNLEGEASTTKGILSARRSAGGIEYLQTDASLENGSSGGPLLNKDGEVVGMNAFATSNSSFGMAISTESLLNKVKELKENKKVNYLDDVRPKNTLTVVLEEIGYSTEDIYHEKDFYKHHKKDNADNKPSSNEEGQSGNNNSSGKVKKVLNGDTSLRELSIAGYNIGFSDGNTNYSITLENDESSISITCIPNAETSSCDIKGNGDFQYGYNHVIITVNSEAGNTRDYDIEVIKPYVYYERATGYGCALDIWRNGDVNSFAFIGCEFYDSDGVAIRDVPLRLENKVSISVYYGWNDRKTSGTCSDGRPIRYLATYDFYTPEYVYYIPLNSVRALLNDDDYVGGIYQGADLTFEVVVETKNQGSIRSVHPWGLSK